MKRREGKGLKEMKVKFDKEEIKQYLFVIRQLSSREIKRKYTRTSLGIIWSVLNPLLTMCVMAVVFTRIFERGIENYPLYLMAGQIIWHLFSGSTNAAMTSLVDNKTLLTRVKQPKIIFPMSKVFASVINFLFTFISFVVLLIVYQIKPSITMLFAPVIIIGIVLFCLGVGYVLSCLYGLFGDIKYLYTVFLNLLMYMSAIFYAIEYVDKRVAIIIENNPIYNYASCFRKVMIYGKWPNQGEIIRLVLWSLIIYVIGYVLFKKMENKLMMHLW